MAATERIESGIEGLDKLIGGGFVKGSLIEIAGSEGTFKSTFAIQFAAKGISKGEKAMYISFEEPVESYRSLASDLGLSSEFARIDFKNIDIKEIVEGSDMNSPVGDAEALAKRIISMLDHPDRLVLDTVTTVALYSSRTMQRFEGGTTMAFIAPSPGDIRVMLFYLAGELRKKGCTVLLLAESGDESNTGDLYVPEQVLKYISDGKIELRRSNLGTRTPRSLVIEKMRHTNHTLDEQPITLTKNGIKVEAIEQ